MAITVAIMWPFYRLGFGLHLSKSILFSGRPSTHIAETGFGINNPPTTTTALFFRIRHLSS
jgi:hypothetical protein